MLRRVVRAMSWLDPALALVEPRLVLTASVSKLTALLSAIEARSFSSPARNLGLAQPSVHRASAHLESEAGRKLFERSRQGLLPTRATKALGQATRLELAELDQAVSDLSELDGQTSRPIVVGALPLSRSVLLPRALVRFRSDLPRQQITICDGAYAELLGGLRRGDIDFMIGVMRDPSPSDDVVQEP
ncbi:MAG: LysR family transcriptional regulator [Rhodothermales bacterium]